MRAFLLVIGMLFVATPAFAMSESIVGYCFTTPQPQPCIENFLAQERKAQEAEQRRADRQMEVQLEQARIQAQGLALFGSGNALINGMNQGFNHMQQPYVSTPQFPR